MSKHSIGWAVVAVAAVSMVGLSVSGLTQHASGDQVLPGGQAAKIRSYYGHSTGTWVTIIPSVEGDHGLILTDFAVGCPNQNWPGAFWLQYDNGSGWKPVFSWSFNDPAASSVVSLRSGIPIPKGAVVRAMFDPGVAGTDFTLSGYIW